MEPFNAGWLSLLPPAAAIVAALISREVISALLVGILTTLRCGGLFGLSVGRFKSLWGMGRAANEDEAEVLAFGLRAWLSCVY